MDTEKIIEQMGGRKAVIEMTGLTRGRISQWVSEQKIPRPWLEFFKAKSPKLDWANLSSEVGRPESKPVNFARRANDRASTS